MNGCINKMSKGLFVVNNNTPRSHFAFAISQQPFDRHSLSILIIIIWIYEPYLFWNRSFFVFRYVLDSDGCLSLSIDVSIRLWHWHRRVICSVWLIFCLCDAKCEPLEAIQDMNCKLTLKRSLAPLTIGYILSHNDQKMLPVRNILINVDFWFRYLFFLANKNNAAVAAAAAEALILHR